MPPGVTRCWIFAAACDGVDAISVMAKQAATMVTMRRAAIPG